MFLLNSRSHQFIATPSPFARRGIKLQGRTLSRSYGTNLPSSFSRVLSSALEYSSRPPVSVCGTVTTAVDSTGAFLGSWESSSLRAQALSSSPLRVDSPFVAQGLLASPPTGLNRYPISGSTVLLRPSYRNHPSRCWTINQLPITYAFLPRLRDRLTLGRLT